MAGRTLDRRWLVRFGSKTAGSRLKPVHMGSSMRVGSDLVRVRCAALMRGNRCSHSDIPGLSVPVKLPQMACGKREFEILRSQIQQQLTGLTILSQTVTQLLKRPTVGDRFVRAPKGKVTAVEQFQRFVNRFAPPPPPQTVRHLESRPAARQSWDGGPKGWGVTRPRVLRTGHYRVFVVTGLAFTLRGWARGWRPAWSWVSRRLPRASRRCLVWSRRRTRPALRIVHSSLHC